MVINRGRQFNAVDPPHIFANNRRFREDRIPSHRLKGKSRYALRLSDIGATIIIEIGIVKARGDVAPNVVGIVFGESDREIFLKKATVFRPGPSRYRDRAWVFLQGIKKGSNEDCHQQIVAVPSIIEDHSANDKAKICRSSTIFDKGIIVLLLYRGEGLCYNKNELLRFISS